MGIQILQRRTSDFDLSLLYGVLGYIFRPSVPRWVLKMSDILYFKRAKKVERREKREKWMDSIGTAPPEPDPGCVSIVEDIYRMNQSI